VGWGNIRANGHPNGRRWRQLVCLGCQRHFLETHGTPFHAKQVEPDKLVWAIAVLAEGLGIRAVARVCEVDPNTVLGWLVEAAEALSQITENRKVEARKSLTFQDPIFGFCRKKANWRQSLISSRPKIILAHGSRAAKASPFHENLADSHLDLTRLNLLGLE
jgi:transposase-like protein